MIFYFTKMGRLTVAQAELMNKRRDNFFAWLDENPSKAHYSQWGGSQQLFEEYNTANPFLPLKHKKEMIRWLYQYRELNQIKLQYLPVKKTEYLRSQLERLKERTAKIEACLA